MSQGKSPLNKYIGKPYEPMGSGNPGYDCITLLLAVLKEFKGFEPDSNILDNYIDIWSGDNLTLIMEIAPRYCDKVWYGDYKTFDPNTLQPCDIIIFRMFGSPTHTGVYVGNNQILTTKDNSISALVDINDTVYSRMICAVFRLKD